MAKRYSMPARLRKYRNIIATIGLLNFVGACVGGPGAFDSAINDLVGKNIDFSLLGPGYYYHPIAKEVIYFGGKKAKVLRETSDEITYERRKYACVYEVTVEKKLA